MADAGAPPAAELAAEAAPETQPPAVDPTKDEEASGNAQAKGDAGAKPDAAPPAHNPPPTNPAKKRKVALFLAYVGHGYQGMQRNPGARTIEDELFRALHAAGAISDANSDEHGFMKVHWMRAARTDKGVSAVGQVVSLKMVLEPEGVVERINAALPEQIRVFGYGRATNGFDSRKHCDKRRYEYILPEWAFDPRQGRGRAQREEAAAADADARLAATAAGGAAAANAVGVHAAAAAAPAAQQPPQQQPDGQQQPEQQQQEQPDGEAVAEGGGAAGAAPPAAGGGEPGEGAAADAPFVFDAAWEQRLTRILSQYEGTHNFHNFTIRKPASAADAKRYVLSFRCAGIVDISGQRWVRLVVVGQSFMLHQIRKMVGTAVAVARGAASEDSLELAMRTSADLNTPMAPELGLFLDEAYFDAYNTQWGALHAPLRLADFQAAADAFKADRLYPHIAARDAEDRVNAEWLKSLNEANYGFSKWAQQAASVTAGSRRPAGKGAGAAAVVGGHEAYGQQHKRLHGGGRGGGSKRRNFGGQAGRVLPPPEQRGGGHTVPEGELSD